MAPDPAKIESGYEADRIDGGYAYPIRWWFYASGDGGRNRRARQGVVDRGFHFARGGRVNTAEEAATALRLAAIACRAEIETWLHQPSHRLGPGGSLIPLDVVDVGEIGSGS